MTKTISLTRRKRDVLQLVGEGLSNRDISVRLGMSENTVRVHVSSILRTLQLANRTQAALWWRDHEKDAAAK